MYVDSNNIQRYYNLVISHADYQYFHNINNIQSENQRKALYHYDAFCQMLNEVFINALLWSCSMSNLIKINFIVILIIVSIGKYAVYFDCSVLQQIHDNIIPIPLS